MSPIEFSMVSPDPFPLTGRYAERNRWEVLEGPGDARVTGLEIIQDEGLAGALSDKVALVTGVSSGMGGATVRALVATGATVFGTARDLKKAKEELGAVLDTGRVHLLYMDHSDLSTVRACAAELRQKCGEKLNIVINNAGVMATPETRTEKDGFELQLQTNHLAHFLLFYLLRDVLLASSAPDFHSRVVSVSSTGHRYSPVQFDDLQFERNYDPWAAYGSSKTANIYMTTQIERLYGSQGLHGFSVSPGSFHSGLQKHTQEYMDSAVRTNQRLAKYLYNLDQACATSIYGAVSKDLEGRGGLYLEGASVAGPAPKDADVIEYGYGSWAFDREGEERLWEVSKKLVGVE